MKTHQASKSTESAGRSAHECGRLASERQFPGFALRRPTCPIKNVLHQRRKCAVILWRGEHESITGDHELTKPASAFRDTSPILQITVIHRNREITQINKGDICTQILSLPCCQPDKALVHGSLACAS